jgi:hypothetical protein
VTSRVISAMIASTDNPIVQVYSQKADKQWKLLTVCFLFKAGKECRVERKEVSILHNN